MKIFSTVIFASLTLLIMSVSNSFGREIYRTVGRDCSEPGIDDDVFAVNIIIV